MRQQGNFLEFNLFRKQQNPKNTYKYFEKVSLRQQGNFENLVLVADTSVNILEPKKDGTFTLDLDVTNLTVRSNGLAEFNLRGSADNLNLRFFNEAPRLNGRNLIVQTANVDHRGANDAIFDVRQSIEGIIRGVGNVICPIEPPSVDVETLSKGRLIFEN